MAFDSLARQAAASVTSATDRKDEDNKQTQTINTEADDDQY